MKLKSAKICDGCRALQVNTRSRGFGTECALKYAQTGESYEAKPAERCPKPRTLNEYVTLLSIQSAVGGGRPILP